MRVGSLFSGVGGFDLGLERAGHRVVWQVEKDKQARSVLRRHWPNVDLYEDVCDVGGNQGCGDRQEAGGGTATGGHDGGRGVHPERDGGSRGDAGTGDDLAAQRTNLAPVDLICGGFPCQDLSVAGRRAGLDGARSGLWFEFHRIVSELRPTWVLVENVPGLRSSDGGRDLATVVRGLAQLGYVGAWRSLDSQYLAVAQRRERIFLLACRDPRAGCPAEVLALAEGMSGHPAPSREAGSRVAGGAEGGATGQSLAIRGRDGIPQAELGTDGLANAVLTPNGGRAGVGAGAVLAPGRAIDDTDHLRLAHTLRAEGFDASEDGTGRGTPLVAQTLTKDMYRSGGATAGNNPGVRNVLVVSQNGSDATIPRRLTPREAERLMGWPDGWTAEGVDENGNVVKLADGPRYRMAGNGVVGTVSEWLGHALIHTEATGD